MSEVPESKSARVNTLIRLARENGWEIQHTALHYRNSPDSECWTLYGPEGLNMTVYPLPNNGAEVYLDRPHRNTWMQISQKSARLYLISNPGKGER